MMIVLTTSMLGLQCPNCGELQFRDLSRFALAHFNREGTCQACGASLARIRELDKGHYEIAYPCIYCGVSHYLHTKREAIWGEDLLPLYCPDREMPVGHIGPRQQVISSCQEMKKSFVQFVSQLVKDEEMEGEFENFFAVYAVMEKLGKMAEERQLRCKCGSDHLSVEILSDHIEVICENCQGRAVIHTDNNKEVLRIIDHMGSILLEENSTCYINGSYPTQHSVKS